MPKAEETSIKGKILIVDDEDFIRTVVGKMLVFLRYESVAAKTGEEALVLYKSHSEAGKPFDAVILDWVMPGGMSGPETLAALRNIDAKVKCILSSGLGNREAQEDGSPMGFAGSISKPYDVKTLESSLAKLIGPIPSGPD